MSKRQSWITFAVLLVYTVLVWALCWFYLRESQWVPIALVFTACGLTIATVYWLVARLGARPAAEASTAKPVTPVKAETSAADPNYRAIRELLNEADAQLARSPLLASERVRPKLADLPLYILAGTEGSGKTSNFLHGDLSPEALAGQVYRAGAIIPTEVANFWYARRALVAEPSGRCFSEGGNRWAGFLDALRGAKSTFAIKSLWQGSPKNSLHGIVLFVDAGPFVGIPDSARVTSLARTIQERLRAAAAAFSSDIPVWVVFSKADSIPFFRDYFGHVRETEDQQPLGCTMELLVAHQRPGVELYVDAETQRLNSRFDILYRSLGQHRLPFLARESGISVKRGIYEFPRELKRVRGTIVQFLVEVFRPNELQPGPLLRGFYFTGTRAATEDMGSAQQGSPLAGSSDATVWMAGSTVADVERRAARGEAMLPEYPRERTVDRWCFVSQLLHQVIRPGQSGVRQYGSQRSVLFRKLAFGSVMSLSVLIALGVLWSTWNNSQMLARLEAAGVALQGAPVSPRDSGRRGLADLDTLRERLVELNTWESDRPWRLRFFLYQGDEVSNRARQTYLRYFQAYLLDPILTGLVLEFSSLPARENNGYPYDRTYDHVKTYVTVTSQDCTATPQLADLLMQSWQTWRNTGEGQADLVRRQFEFYAQELSRKRVAKSPQNQAVGRGRDYLNSFSEEQRLYSQLVDEVAQTVPAARLADYAPKYAQVLSDVREIPGAFTRAGWAEMQIKIAAAKPKGESCVLGKSKVESVLASQSTALSDRVRDLYMHEYVRRWQEMLTAVQVRPYNDPKDAERKLATLDDDMTLLGLMFMTREGTEAARLGSYNSAQSKLIDLAKDATAKQLEASRRGRAAKAIAGAVLPADETAATPDPATAFQPVTVLFSPETSRRNFNDAKNAAYTNALNELRKAMRDLADSSNPRTDVELNKAAKKAVDDGSDAVRTIAHQFDSDAAVTGEQVTRLLSAPFEAARKHFVPDFGRANAERLNTAGAAFCRVLNPLLRKFPFKADGSEASVADVGNIFNPKTGELQRFYNQALAQFLAKAQGRYNERADAPQDVKINRAFLDSFNRLMLITDALFAEGASSASMRYKLAVRPNPDVRGTSLVIDGQQGGQQGAVFNWPGASPQGIDLEVRTADTDIPFARYGGPWAIFELMAEADSRAPGSRDITLSRVRRGPRSQPAPIVVGNKEVVVSLHVDEFPGGIDSAFDRDFFSGIRCVSTVAER